MGATSSLVKKIFLTEGALIAFTGASLGLVLGGGICWAQDQFGLVGMGMGNAVVSAYPIEMKIVDFVSVSVVIVVITFLISYFIPHDWLLSFFFCRAVL